jgi:hypothetical protein
MNSHRLVFSSDRPELAAANKEKYPWFHEFGIPVDNYATT